ncbi:ankyrin repeat-containing domain protein [Mycena rebaudengoi]|nr:ankyrin repeat-containing domain protein [Mycena rebaudengoi]
MTPPKTVPPPAPATQSKTDKLVDVATTSLEVGIEILGLLSNATKNVPCLGAITGCIEKLVDIRKSMKSNKERAAALLNSIWDVSCVLAVGLQSMDPQSQSTAANLLRDDLHSVLDELCRILEEWTSKGFVKRLWSHGDFSALADGLDSKINVFRDAFSTSRLIALSQGQDAMDAKLQMLVDKQTRNKLDEWLMPSMRIAESQRSAANARHQKTGLWLFERPEFREWIYAPGSFLWIHGISGSGKTVLSSTIIDTIHARAEHYVFFYFDTNNSEQQTVTQLLCSLVTQLSIRSHPPDSKLDALWMSHNRGQKLLTDAELISDALLPLLREFGQKPVFIVLDALDECSDRRGLLHLISKMVDSKLPNVHLLVTSRSEVQAGHPEFVKLAVSVPLEGCVDGDIELYLTEVLSNEKGWIYENRDEIKGRLLERSNGMFRLVALQLDELRNCDGRRSQVEKALKNMPITLNTIYDRILQNIKNPDMLASVCRAMNWLIFSKRPMMLNEIIDALAFDFEHQPLIFDTDERMGQDALLAACAGFVAMSGECTVKLAHSSVKEYFLRAAPLMLPDACEISEQAAHHLLARTCIAYLCSFDHVLYSDADLEQYPFILYATENWVFHLTLCDDIGLDKCKSAKKWQKHIGSKQVFVPASRAAQNVDVCKVPSHTTELIDVVMQLLQPESTQYTTLLHLYDVEDLCLRYRIERAKAATSLPPLYVAASLGIGQIVWGLQEQGADLNAQCGRLGNALQAAAYQGHIEITRLLLECGADVNAQGGLYGNALQAASNRGHIEIACLLLEKGADVNAQGGIHGNALQAVSKVGHIEIACLLLESGAVVNAQGGDHGTALQAASNWGHIEIVHLLLENGADVNAQGGKYGSALQAASTGGHIEIAHLLLESGAGVNAQGGIYGNALQAVSNGGHIDIARLLLERDANVNAQSETYGNALQAASNGGHIEVARLLLERGADVNAQGGICGNALQAASYGGHIEIARLLLESGADVSMEGGRFHNALQAASFGGHISICSLLLESGADVNAQGGLFANALYAVSRSSARDIELVRLLHESGADVNAEGGDYGNPLQAASYGGQIEIARFLLERGAEVNAQGGEYGNALQAASHRGHIEIVRLLLESGAAVNAQGGIYGNALQAASNGGHIDITHLLLERDVEVNAQDETYVSALQPTSNGEYIEIARLLLERGADVNTQGGICGNALQAASNGGHIEIVCMLLESGADVNAHGGKYGNALQAASLGGHNEIVHLLLEMGATVNMLTEDDKGSILDSVL